MTRAWGLPLVFLVSGGVLAAGLFSDGSRGPAVAFLLVFVLLAGVNSPLFFPRSTGEREARRRGAADGMPVVFWRPGCVFCVRLRLRLGRAAHRLHWVDIRRDPAAAAAVRAANGGDETVPTVLVDGRPHTNPDPAWVREQLAPRG
ncbi:glutaredoxin domain-containing protein [Streptomyces tagetis]|uniref:Glutaredoxin domain-containing protein n=1 Tax=Streptomyces tagetis TaxID=2820809 RepID=A0A940XMK6_9ACTN|nr:glutaredoxin domain-containing protein [Streptomyces sp. RG38]MBQ0829116.1 hypothetical protein [Streptomyces sp. RG38]